MNRVLCIVCNLLVSNLYMARYYLYLGPPLRNTFSQIYRSTLHKNQSTTPKRFNDQRRWIFTSQTCPNTAVRYHPTSPPPPQHPSLPLSSTIHSHSHCHPTNPCRNYHRLSRLRTGDLAHYSPSLGDATSDRCWV